MARATRSTRAATERVLDVPQDKVFWVTDGRVLRNLAELESALRDMSDDTYRSHANEVKNDFSNWVRDVIGDDKLARDLHKSQDKAQAAKAVADRIVWLKSKV